MADISPYMIALKFMMSILTELEFFGVLKQIADFIFVNGKVFITYMVVINVLSFGLYGYDKYKAMIRAWRVPESTLMLCAISGGALGSYLSMKIFRHKTRKAKFYILVPLFMVCQLIIIIGIIVVKCYSF